MIIGIDATRANKPHKTGVEWYSYHLIRELTKLPSRHTFRLYFGNNPERRLSDLGPSVQYRILRWPFPYLWTQLRLSWEMLMNPVDVLFIPAQIVPFIHPIQTLTTIHDVAFKPYPKSYRTRSRLYLDLAAKMARKLPMILTISEFSKREINKYYAIPLESIAVTPLGFSHETNKPSAAAVTKYDIRVPYLLYVGRLERKKNIITLVKSFNLIKQEPWGNQFQLVLVGDKGFGWDAIEKVIKQSDYRDDIKIIGWIPEEDKHSLLSQATAFILLSAYEGFGLPLLEAMAARTPIIASDQAALPEVAGNAAAIIHRGDIVAIRDALHTILFNSGFRTMLVDRGTKRLREFSWRQTAVKTLAAIDALAKKL